MPDNVRSVFKPIDTKLPGVKFTELLPKLAQVNDKFTHDPLDELHARTACSTTRPPSTRC